MMREAREEEDEKKTDDLRRHRETKIQIFQSLLFFCFLEHTREFFF